MRGQQYEMLQNCQEGMDAHGSSLVLNELIAESMWRAMGWASRPDTTPVIRSLKKF